jgi:prevent-host-death family protein
MLIGGRIEASWPFRDTGTLDAASAGMADLELRERTDRRHVDLSQSRRTLDRGDSVDMAIFYGYTIPMDVSIAEAKNRLPELIRAVEGGAIVVITRHGKPVAQLTPAPVERRQVRLGGMKDRVQLLPGWDAPVDLDSLLGGG